MNIQHVSGKNKGKIILYTLSTCIWCKKTKHLFDKMDVEYDYIDVDMLEGTEKEKIVQEQEKWNPLCSYPTVVINDKKCIVGFNEEEIKEALSG